ncbi:hypothetical protein BDY17DRAFT_246404 [Neohortaea acidophila]|uniref:NAD binding Rossmann fold oxidoreductase n=1 Tax=Neohortaea acidophila TaxID=245834 RepID=A0A6A6Q364_9PEZI|nr:uncharacterized protein BDY17DRAFT_246404 [Neohortaea acidophila]KAF2486093.1 hypothetical protein BDY17DRAFT_246404 [Neohortaea acidophila]
MAVNPWNVAVVGYGLSAKVFHIPFITAVPDLKLYGVVQRNPKPDNDAEKDHAGIKSWRSVEDMLKDDEVDVVVITSIPTTHFEMCKKSLEAGKNVVVEKPFVPTSREADELIELAKTKGKLITVYQNRRWDSDFVTLQKIIKDGLLGDIAEFETHFDRHRPDAPPATWKVVDEPGNESIYDLGSHLIDQVYCLFGMPQRVTAFLGKQRRGVTQGPHDSFTVLLHYDGMLVTAKAGVISPHVRQLRYWVRGTKGSWYKYHLDVQEDQLRKGMRPTAQGFAIEPESHHAILTVAEGSEMKRSIHPTVSPLPTYLQFYKTLVDALQGNSGVPVDAAQCRDVLRIIEMAQQSSAEGSTITTAA